MQTITFSPAEQVIKLGHTDAIFFANVVGNTVVQLHIEYDGAESALTLRCVQIIDAESAGDNPLCYFEHDGKYYALVETTEVSDALKRLKASHSLTWYKTAELNDWQRVPLTRSSVAQIYIWPVGIKLNLAAPFSTRGQIPFVCLKRTQRLVKKYAYVFCCINAVEMYSDQSRAKRNAMFEETVATHDLEIVDIPEKYDYVGARNGVGAHDIPVKHRLAVSKNLC